MSLISREIEAHYLKANESERLSNESGELERIRTQAILARYLPPAPAEILDVGGGAGAHAFPLATQGYRVYLIDPVELHLEQARSHQSATGVALASISHGDARRLDLAPESADAVLMLGPLYHLTERSERLQALHEAKRILKPGGVLFAASISRFGSLIDGLARGFFRDAQFRQIIEGDLKGGAHRNLTGRLEYFTTAYFHRPEELAAEVREAGFHDTRTLAIEGPAWNAAHFRAAWNDWAQKKSLLEFLSLIEAEPSIQGASAHVMAVAFRP